MSAAAFIDRLHGVRQTGSGQWLAQCPAHEDRRASLSICEKDDGRILVHCFASCSVEEILAAVGLDFDALFPERAIDNRRPREGRPFPATDVLRAIAFEALVAAMVICRVTGDRQITDGERARLILACERLLAAVEAGGLSVEANRLKRQIIGHKDSRLDLVEQREALADA